MDQKKLYTDFWNLLSDSEDYFRYGMKTRRGEAPDFSADQPVPGPESFVLENEVLPPTENCENCPMHKAGRKAVSAMGTVASDLWVVTDPPSLEAEREKMPLGHAEMDYFQKWMTAIELSLPGGLLLQNLTRCRTPGNRPPFAEELNRCGREIESRLKIHRPKAILAMGPSCAGWFSGLKGQKVSEIRGRLYMWRDIPVVVTYSPDQVLSYGELKRPVWEDLKSLRNILSGS